VKIRELKKLPVNSFFFTYDPKKGIDTSKVEKFGRLGEADFILYNGSFHYISIDFELNSTFNLSNDICFNHSIDIAFDFSGKIVTHEYNDAGKIIALGFCSDDRIEEAKQAFSNEVKNFITKQVLAMRRTIDKHQSHLAELC
tara:strand:+ start:6278 stop:6703 length:426 start_codon:yes stop_codon:yes gene_type:complete